VAKCYESLALRREDAQLRLAGSAGGGAAGAQPVHPAAGGGGRAATGQPRGAVTPAHRVDDLDRRIIEALQANGRESFRAIAARVGVSEATVRARYSRLTAEGIVQVTAITNPLGLGYEQALVGVKTSGPPSAVADEISQWPEADYVIVTAGQFDIVVEIVASDRGHLLDLTNRMRSLSDVVSTETFFYLEMWKQLYDWGSGTTNGGNG
jgi:Lrp/AsnC family transcriptional regulator for asnA, asnC and gidA